MKDPVVEKTELVLDAFQYAHDNNLDINNLDDVKKILKALDPKLIDEAEEFKELLLNAEAFMEMTAREKTEGKKKLPN